YVLSDFLFVMSFYVIRYRRKLVKRSLANAFPEKDPAQRKAIEKQFYRNLCDYAVEVLKTVTIPRAELTRRMAFTHPEVIESFKAAGQSIISYASHQFNWEWLLISASANHP